jgi:hypothetical protein
MSKIILQLLQALLAVIAPLLFNYLTDLRPGFPLDLPAFTSFLFWLFSALIGVNSAHHAAWLYYIDPDLSLLDNRQRKRPARIAALVLSAIFVIELFF